MIFSSIKNGDSFEKYPAAIQTALEYLKSHDFASMEPGVYEIQGKDIYAQVFDAMTEDVADRRPESHEKYLDVCLHPVVLLRMIKPARTDRHITLGSRPLIAVRMSAVLSIRKRASWIYQEHRKLQSSRAH